MILWESMRLTLLFIVQTLTDKEYQRLRDASVAIIREMGVECGGSNVQMAVNPVDGEVTLCLGRDVSGLVCLDKMSSAPLGFLCSLKNATHARHYVGEE